MYCPECGREVEESAKFCKYCGKQLQYGTTDYSTQNSQTHEDSYQSEFTFHNHSEDAYSNDSYQNDTYQNDNYQNDTYSNDSYQNDYRSDYNNDYNNGYTPLDQQQQYQSYNSYENSGYTEDKVSILFTILSFLIPIVGIILYFVWRNKTPNKATACLYAALAAIAMNAVVLFLN